MIDKKKTELEKVVLIGVINSKHSRNDVMDNLDELKLLCKTAGSRVENIFLQNTDFVSSAYYIGKGKAEEVAGFVKENKISAVVFDDELSAVQIRNLERLCECKVLDRSSVILDIFASHAKSREAKTQVELAQYEYFLPRLTRQWTHLSKQYGGIGTKGPGETQIETDRRIIRNKISLLKHKLKEIEIQRDTQRKRRKDLFRVALVGYTNVGKSTVLNLLTGADVLAEDKLFATLDTTTRNYKLKGNIECLISDTVGFIKKLPHSLVASFRSTLKDVLEADLVLHIADASNQKYEEQIAVVNDTLNEIKVDLSKVQLVFNKIDKPYPDFILRAYPSAVLISAMRGINIPALEEKIIEKMKMDLVEEEIEIPITDTKKIDRIKSFSEKISVKFHEDKINIKVLAKKSNFKKILNLF